MKKIVISAIAVFVSGQINAAMVVTPVPVTITSFYVQTTYGGGDVAFVVSSAPTGCEHGFWLRPSDAGFKSAYAAILTAHTAKTPLYIWAYDNELWSGSSGHFCRVDAIRPM